MPDRSTQIAKALRRRMTDTERHLWTQLRAHRLARWKFRRQQPIGPYIVDFVCFEARLVIEVAENCSCVCPRRDGFALRTSAIHGGRMADSIREARPIGYEKRGWKDRDFVCSVSGITKC